MPAKNTSKKEQTTIYDMDMLSQERSDFQHGRKETLTFLITGLLKDAEESLQLTPNSVIDKITLPPSEDPHDYWHPAPYWWPNPRSANGLPYVRRDGQRVPGTNMYEPESDKYDRTRVQLVFDNSTSLALAWYFSEKQDYATYAARILDRFFVNPATRMNPNLKYAQVRMGHDGNRGSRTGIIELKDFYYYLDSVRLLELSSFLPAQTLDPFKAWLASYLDWLLESPQGKEEREAKNNHGTCYDLQTAAIAAFLGNKSLVAGTLERSKTRIGRQFKADGSQPEELKRTDPAHYCCFNLQSWINLARLASACGVDLWSYQAKNGASLEKGADWLLKTFENKWSATQDTDFDKERITPIWHALPDSPAKEKHAAKFPKSKYEVKRKFFPHDGIRPYWNLG